MKLLILMAFSFSGFSYANADIKELKVDQKWRVKYDANIWDYKYVKIMNEISPHVFENKKEKFKLILQKETHALGSDKYASLVESKCQQANAFYSQNKSGGANVELINGVKTCYIHYINTSGKKVAEYVYPEKGSGVNYDLYTYVWNSENDTSKQSVINFLQGFIK